MIWTLHTAFTATVEMEQPPSLLDSFRINAGDLPPEWVNRSYEVHIVSRILLLWENTVSLINNRELLCQDQQRYLAMIYDHKVSHGKSR